MGLPQGGKSRNEGTRLAQSVSSDSWAAPMVSSISVSLAARILPYCLSSMPRASRQPAQARQPRVALRVAVMGVLVSSGLGLDFWGMGKAGVPLGQLHRTVDMQEGYLSLPTC